VEYRGLIHLKGKQGRLEIHYNGSSWYAHITFEGEKKLYESHLMMHNAWRERAYSKSQMESHGVGLDRAGLVEADDFTPRANLLYLL